jgi:hypothetical protein
VGYAGAALEWRACSDLVVASVAGIALAHIIDISIHADRAVRVGCAGLTVAHAADAVKSGAAV